MTGPARRWLADGRRLHLNHGPIDLIIEAHGHDDEVDRAYRQAECRFQTILTELVAELPALRRPLAPGHRFSGVVAQRMALAVEPHRAVFVTPMAAVAGAVADEVLCAMLEGRSLVRAFVNNGGDIAIHLARGARFSIAITGAAASTRDRIELAGGDGIGGVATSGWRGRSFSLGIADAVTVVASSAAVADAAATLIANAVDLPGNPAICRELAETLQPDTDLHGKMVTVAVGALSDEAIENALGRGVAAARAMIDDGLIAGAALFLGRMSRVCGDRLSAVAPARIPEEALHA